MVGWAALLVEPGEWYRFWWKRPPPIRKTWVWFSYRVRLRTYQSQVKSWYSQLSCLTIDIKGVVWR